MKLSNLKKGEMARISFISDSLSIKRRLLDIGFTKSSEVLCLFKSPFQGPVAYKIKNTVVALRDEDAKYIKVEAC